MNPDHLLRHVIVVTLQILAQHNPRLDGKVPRALLLGTAMVESDLKHLQQIGGPAMGLWQVEPATHDDIWTNWLAFRPDQHAVYGSLAAFDPSAEQMRYNLMYGCAMARLVYWRARERLPDLDAMSLAGYHKRHYNTHLGATDVEKSIKHFERALRFV